MASDDGTDAGRSAAQPEERKTETTLTTRIRINIPGSRPIPPVVVRTPVADSDSSGGDTPAARPKASQAPAGGAGAGRGPGAGPDPAKTPAESAPPAAEEKTSDWFAPRKSGAGKAGQGGGGTNGAGLPGGSAAPGTPPPGSGRAAGVPAGPRPGGAGGPQGTGTTGGARPGGVVGSMSAPGASRPGGTNGAGLPGATGGPVAPGHGGGTGSFDVTEALAVGPLGDARRDQGGPGGQRRDDLPYFSEGGRDDRDGFGADGQGGPGAPGGHGGFDAPGGPAGPTSGPVTGDGPLVPPGGPGGISMEPGESFTAPGDGQGPGARRGPGAAPAADRGAALSDDTAVLTPQKLVPQPGTPGYTGARDNVSGHTVTSGIPVVPSAGGGSFPQGPHADGSASRRAPKLPEPVAQNVPKAAPPKKKGRNKLVLLAVAAFVVLGGAYGAGLLMNHTDVPKGTTVLGLDIGGGTRDDAVKKLDDAFGNRVGKPLKLSVGGRTVSLAPDKAGLQFDIQNTVDKAATSDYNPVSVIGSLLGNHRVVEPVMPVDEEKLQAALSDLGGGSGSVTEGTIKFENGKAVAVYGKPGQGIDAAAATRSVTQAYRTLVETGTASPVSVPTTTRQPTVSDTEVDRELKEFAQPAMSDVATVRVDALHSIKFGALSLPKILGFKAVGGKLVETYDLNALKEAYGTTFSGVQIQSATGKRDVLPQDVASALRKALRGKTPAERVGVIETNPN